MNSTFGQRSRLGLAAATAAVTVMTLSCGASATKSVDRRAGAVPTNVSSQAADATTPAGSLATAAPPSTVAAAKVAALPSAAASTQTPTPTQANLVAASPTPAPLNLFIAVGNNQRLTVSADEGRTWQERYSFGGINSDGATFTAAVMGNGTIVAMAGEANSSPGTNMVYSTDGAKTWTAKIVGNNNGGRLAFGNGLFEVFFGASFAQSTDGITWTAEQPVAANNCTYAGNIRGLTYGAPGGKGIFIAWGDNHHMLTSYDGITWSNIVCGLDGAGNGSAAGISNIQYFNGQFFMASSPAMVSSDGINWQPFVNPPTEVTNFVTAVISNNAWLFVFWDGAYTSTDLVNWTPAPGYNLGTYHFYPSQPAVAADGTMVGNAWPDGRLQSVDYGKTWQGTGGGDGSYIAGVFYIP